jgi:hypothetical protein
MAAHAAEVEADISAVNASITALSTQTASDLATAKTELTQYVDGEISAVRGELEAAKTEFSGAIDGQIEALSTDVHGRIDAEVAELNNQLSATNASIENIELRFGNAVTAITAIDLTETSKPADIREAVMTLKAAIEALKNS